MSGGWLTEYVEPYKLAARDSVLEGELPFTRFPRLAALLEPADDPGRIRARLQFGRDDNGRCRLQGQLSADGRLFCNRCAEGVPYALACTVDVRIVRSDAEAKALLPEHDPVVLDEQRTALAGLLEDDLLLGLPDVGCTDRDTCPRRPATGVVAGPATGSSGGGAGGDGDSDGADADNPFSILKQLKDDN